MYRFIGLLVLLGLAGLGLAQTASHTVTVYIPSVLSVSLDATDFLFNFGSSATGSVTVGGTPYPKAGESAYTAFLDSGDPSQVFAPTRVSLLSGTGDYATLTVRSNRAQWTVSVYASSGSLDAPLNNARIKVYAEKIRGKGDSLTSSPTPLPLTGSLDIIRATGSGQGKSEYKVYNLLELQLSDEIPSSGYSSSVTLTYTIASP